jgi:UV DNA damage repair endonuclease
MIKTAYEELKAADNEELNKVKKHLQALESDRITKDLDELRRQWMIELQKERALISLSEWNDLKKEVCFVVVVTAAILQYI